MQRRVDLLSCLLVFAAFLASVPVFAQPTGVAFSISGGRILKNGSEFVIRGVSVSGPGSEGKRKTVLDVDVISRLWNFNLVRVGCSLKPHTGAAEIKDLDEIIRVFTARGVVVLIDPRDHVGGYYADPAKPTGGPTLGDLVGWYKDVATRYRGNPYVWFEVMSGPGPREPRRAGDPWLPVHEAVLDAIRGQAAANNIIVCEGRNQGSETPYSSALPVNESDSALLTFGPSLIRKYSNLLFGFHIDENWNAGAIRLDDFLDRLQERGLAVFVSEYGNTRWADSTPAIEAMLPVCKARHIGRCVWNWSPTDSQHLCAPDDKGGGWQVDTTDGSRPSNLSWLGDKVWDDNHGTGALHGPLLDRSGWTATSFVAALNASDHTNQPDGIFGGYVSDEDFWTSRKAQEPGQWFQVDMGAKRTFSRIMIDTRARYADYPRGYELYVSNDAVNWGAPIASGKNDQSVLRLTLPVQNARYFKIVQTGKTWHHWVVANIEVYAPIGSAKSVAANSSAHEAVLEPRAWSAAAGPNRWYEPEVALRPQRDPNRSTATGQAQQPGHYYQVDMGEPQRFHKIVLNPGRSIGDYPRGYEVTVSSDGIEWSKPIAAGRGGPITTITFPSQTARFVRITLTRYARNYWTLAELRVYGDAPGAATVRGTIR